MTSPLPLLGLGLLLGLRHAMDPDHIVAVAAISARTRRPLAASWLGVVWGLGHTLTLFVAGGVIILLDVVVPPRVGLSFEFAVALALIVVGLINLRGPRAVDPAAVATAPPTRLPALRAFGVGLVHGLAGSAAVALLVLATVREPAWAVVYLGLFGLGTMLGMACVTAGMASSLSLAGERWRGLGPGVRVATGVLSLVFGIWLVVQIGWHDGLFGALPRWEPR